MLLDWGGGNGAARGMAGSLAAEMMGERLWSSFGSMWQQLS